MDTSAIDFRPALEVINLLLVSATKSNFQGSHGPDGSAWLPLKRPRRRGVRARRKRGNRNPRQGDKPLLDTGLLRASVTGQDASSISVIEADRLQIGTNLDYAPFHQHGTVHIPARPFLGWTPELRDEAREIVTEHAVKELRRLLGQP